MGRRTFPLHEDRPVARTYSLAWVVLALCLARPTPAGEPGSTPRATTPQVQQAVDRAVQYLQTESAAWLNTRKCAACHEVPLAPRALGVDGRKRYADDRK